MSDGMIEYGKWRPFPLGHSRVPCHAWKIHGLATPLKQEKTLPIQFVGSENPRYYSSNIFVYVSDGTSYVISSTQPSGHEDKNLNSGPLWTLALDPKQTDECESWQVGLWICSLEVDLVTVLSPLIIWSKMLDNKNLTKFLSFTQTPQLWPIFSLFQHTTPPANSQNSGQNFLWSAIQSCHSFNPLPTQFR